MTVSIVITTRNRQQDLRRALVSALAQDYPTEIIVVDDASTDGTREMICTEFPNVRVIAHQESTGYIRSRNEGIAAASAPIVILIDDDSEFSTSTTVRQTVKDFDHPAVGAVALPFVNVARGETPQKMPPDKQAVWITTSYVGCAHAVRRGLFLELGGYCEEFVHYGEEADFCRRLLRAGFVTRLGRAAPVKHYVSPEARDTYRERYYGARAAMLLACNTLPWPVLPAHLGAEAFWKLWRQGRNGGLRATIRGLVSGIYKGIRGNVHRTPLRWREYCLLLRMRVLGPIAIRDGRLLPHTPFGQPQTPGQ